MNEANLPAIPQSKSPAGSDEPDVDRDIPLFLGLSGLELAVDSFDFGHGVILRKTYAHLMAPFLMAFARPEPGKPHPAPWKAAGGGLGFDIVAELSLPPMPQFAPVPHLSIGRNLLALLRLSAAPSIVAPVVATEDFATAANPSVTVEFTPLEVEPRRFRFQLASGPTVTPEMLEWTKLHWERALFMLSKHSSVRLALDSIDRAQFLGNSSLILVSIWGALEALFSPAKAELRFRVSSNIAVYLEPPGAARLALQKHALELYDARSSAAHGSDKAEVEALLQSLELLRRVLLKIFTDDHVPTKDELHRWLFGVDS